MAVESKSTKRQKWKRATKVRVIEAEHQTRKNHLERERTKLLQAQERSVERQDELDPDMHGEAFDDESVLRKLELNGYFCLSLTIDMNRHRLERLEEQIQYKRADLLRYTDGSLTSSNHFTMGRIMNDLREDEVECREMYLTDAAYEVEWMLEQLLSLHHIRNALKMRAEIGWFGKELDYYKLTEWAAEERARTEWDVRDWVAIWRRVYCCVAKDEAVALDQWDQKSLESAGLAPKSAK